ncbi:MULTISPECIES: glycosyltransferase [unclassified Enterococcus]|jgi:hypothetical protein|uniref:glycosyltransferase n=1 Tax=unclassified Enterococcus TaxID=2608891 RepID=UPI003D2DEE20
MPTEQNKINHYLITKFNIPFIGQTINTDVKQIDVGTDVNYLEYRFSIFEKNTVPSIQKQTNKNFEWLVLFSDQTPDFFRNKIERIQEQVPNLKPLFQSKEEDFHDVLLRYLQENRNGNVVTTRLDNDDALNIRFVEIIQKNIHFNKKAEVLIFPDGIQYDLNKQVMTNYHFPNNHFSTLFWNEKESVKTILDYNHMEIINLFDTNYLEVNKPMWLETVHGGNILNRMFLKFSILTFDFSILKEFGYVDIPQPAKAIKVYPMVLFNKPLNAYYILTNYGMKRTLKKIINRIRR